MMRYDTAAARRDAAALIGTADSALGRIDLGGCLLRLHQHIPMARLSCTVFHPFPEIQRGQDVAACLSTLVVASSH